MVGRHEHKLAGLASIAHTALADDPLEADFDVVVEATGSTDGFARARSLLRPRGTLILKSTFFGETPVDTAPFVIDEITLIGSRCGPFGPAIRALADARIDPRPLIETTMKLSDGTRALEKAAERGVAKVLLDARA